MVVREHLLQELLLPRPGRQLALVHHRKIWHPVQEGGGEEAAIGPSRSVNLHAGGAAARGVFLEHVSGQAQRLQLVDPAAGESLHLGRMVGAALDSHQADPLSRPFQPDLLPGDPQADLDLGADGHEVDVPAQFAGRKGVETVAAVIPDVLAEEAGRDADPGPFHGPK